MKHTSLTLGTWFLGLAALTGLLQAEIPEPDNIIYGVITRNGLPVRAADTDVVVEARRNSDGTIVASYRMGDSTRSGDNFTLRVPLEAFAPVFDPWSSVTGTALTLVVSDRSGSFAEVPLTVGGRGQFHELNINESQGFDSDNDGLVDEWEIAWFGNLLQSATTDKDGDGLTDLEEYLAGTDPNNSNSRFRLGIRSSESAGKEVFFVAQAQGGSGYQGKIRRYTLEWTTDLDNNLWTPLTGYIGVLGAGQTVRYPIPAEGPQSVFYRVVIQLEDVGPPLPR
ncbi:MAG: hypothetical protein JNN07_06510 [Verrucomicrobiales bacterium]|nr:hypothetical protein [Verrucomicrobiales bacterium]